MTRSLQALWTGADGSMWDLTSLRSTVNLVALDGLGVPTFNQQFSESGARDGRRYEGTQFRQSELTLQVSVGDVDPLPGRKRRRRDDEWRRLDAAWRKAVSPERTGTLTLVTGGGDVRRSIDLRMAQPALVPPGRDPALIGEATYTYVMTADDQPWWRGAPVQATFAKGADGKPFFSGGSGNRLYISETDRLGTATLTNDGDRPAYPMWFAKGPFTSAEVGLGEESIGIRFARVANQYVFVESAREAIYDENQRSLWPLMGFTDPTFAPIPPKQTVELRTVLNDSTEDSAIGVSLIPLYESPW